MIVGGESGAGARPMRKEWVLSLRDQCERAQVPFFFKQWGGVRKSKAGRELDGQHTTASPTECSCRSWRTPSAWRQSPSLTGYPNRPRLHPNSLYSQSRRRRATSGLCPTSLLHASRPRISRRPGPIRQRGRLPSSPGTAFAQVEAGVRLTGLEVIPVSLTAPLLPSIRLILRQAGLIDVPEKNMVQCRRDSVSGWRGRDMRGPGVPAPRANTGPLQRDVCVHRHLAHGGGGSM